MKKSKNWCWDGFADLTRLTNSHVCTFLASHYPCEYKTWWKTQKFRNSHVKSEIHVNITREFLIFWVLIARFSRHTHVWDVVLRFSMNSNLFVDSALWLCYCCCVENLKSVYPNMLSAHIRTAQIFTWTHLLLSLLSFFIQKLDRNF